MSSSHIFQQNEKYWETQQPLANVAPLIRYTVNVTLMWLRHPLAIVSVSPGQM